MRIIKKDFVDENTESYCSKGHKLSSGTAYYMQAEDGTIYFGGKQCAEINGHNNLKDVPDLTKSLVSLAATNGGSGCGGGCGDKLATDQKKSLAISYLLLREELLHDFKLNGRPLSINSLANYYISYQDIGDLSVQQINHILNIEKYAANKINSKLSLKNLSTCHAYKFILERTAAHLQLKNNIGGVTFIESLVRYLKSHCHLTKEQVKGLDKWIQFLPIDLRKAKLKSFE
ncbi:TPA: hypothetical protein ACX6QT_000007 [Photobacterium damselae]